VFDTSSYAWQEAYQSRLRKKTAELDQTFVKGGIDNTLIFTDEDYVKPLMKLFKKRESRR